MTTWTNVSMLSPSMTKLFTTAKSCSLSFITSSDLITWCGMGHKQTGEEFPVAVAIANVIALLILLLVCWKIWQILCWPTDLFHDLTAIGFVHHDRRIPKIDEINMTRRQRDFGEIPPVYPNGWFRILDSEMLQKGQLKNVYALGEHFAVFRNNLGKIRILDAYCPHLGANMAVGGRVVNDDCLECPFHGWKFNGEDGKCIDIPYTEKMPKFISVRSWPACEIHGIIYVWYHCDKEEPTWSIPSIPGLGGLKYVGRTEHVVNCHIQEIPENAADTAHLGHLHKPVIGNDIEKTHDSVWNCLQHDIQAEWKLNKDRRELSEMNICDKTHILIFGKRIPIKTFIFNIEQIGPGNVHIFMNTPYLRGVLIQTTTPTEPLIQRLSHTLYIAPMVPICLAKVFLRLEATQIERDIMIWNNKTYKRSPLLVKEESAILKHRRWYQQFYSKNSPRLNRIGTKIVNPTQVDVTDW